ncbi:ABC transporter permease [Blastococcus sp. VKM Ac-2987]|uniref:ABC transporter permease n=1 Tax=Blastococcus sp. VKM Ac-2987 TaxID=3004141 RepID=UPI0022AB8C48|nr:ABC transporter permease [Blastococcus sp. VKM Ac-2987]MCZ2860863.1 ABC transporter permease [Blastococcus sp. VKM Ac-2987]
MSATDVTTRSTPGTRPAGPRPSTSGQLRSLSRAMLRSFFRDRTSLLFAFLFPLMFLVVFGLVFRGDGAGTTPLAVVGEGPVVTALPDDVVESVAFEDAQEAVAAVEAGDVAGAVIEQGGEVTLYFAASDQVQAGTVQQVVSSVINEANLAATGQPPAITLTTQQVESERFGPIQFLAPGILSWGVATSAAFGAALTLVAWRNRQVLRRLRLSPAPAWTIVAARVGVSLLVALLQAVVFIAVAMLPVFGLELAGQWWLALPILLCGTCSFLGVGLLVGAIAKTEEAASALANFIVLPMAFLSGVFFDLSAAPSWMQSVSRVLPLGWMNDGITDVLVRGEGVAAVWLPCLVLLAFALVVGAAATRLFRWES